MAGQFTISGALATANSSDSAVASLPINEAADLDANATAVEGFVFVSTDPVELPLPAGGNVAQVVIQNVGPYPLAVSWTPNGGSQAQITVLSPVNLYTFAPGGAIVLGNPSGILLTEINVAGVGGQTEVRYIICSPSP